MTPVYVDEQIIVINKTAGQAVQSARPGDETVTAMLEKEYGKIGIVHRLDSPVSGLIVFARTKKAAAGLSRQFSEHLVRKRYLCAVDSAPPSEEGVLKNFMRIPPGTGVNKVYIAEEGGKNTREAVLEYKTVYRTEKYYILMIELKTGRKHQIRAQLAAAGCHIKGDVKYGARRGNPGGGIHLHAWSLEFAHPATGKKMSFTAPLPDDPIWNAAAAGGALSADTD